MKKKIMTLVTAVVLLTSASTASAQNFPRAANAGQKSGVTEAWIAAGVGIAAAVAVILLAPNGSSSHAH